MVAEDKQEKERVDARNALEEYVYDLRAKLSDEDELATFITETDKEQLCNTLDDTENWLYEEGEDCQRQIYSERLTRLKVYYLIDHLAIYISYKFVLATIFINQNF
jgi:heat shock protein 110kDa